MAVTGTEMFLARRTRKVSQGAVGERLGLFKHTLVDIERGRLEVSQEYGLRILQAINAIADAREAEQQEQAA